MGAGRDEFVDFCRAFSLIVVVIWHWVFTILIWSETGPSASNPIAFTDGLWLLTWLLQVMPVFFFVGGFAHLKVWEKNRESGGGYWTFVGGRAKRLLIPSAALAGTWIALGIIVGTMVNAPWLGRTVLLIISPLWFIVVYMMLVVIAPIAIWAHKRFDPVVVVLLAGCAILVDVARFANKITWVALLNFVIVWGLCHQLGFYYERLVNSSRKIALAMALGGLIALIALVNTNIYPGSMVGVPGDDFSNMGPPTLCIVALLFLQVGVVLLIRDWVLERLERPRWERVNDVVNRFALPLYLFHSTGYAIVMAAVLALGYRPEPEPTLSWWAWRPFWLIAPLIATIPVILIFGRRWTASPKPVAPSRW